MFTTYMGGKKLYRVIGCNTIWYKWSLVISEHEMQVESNFDMVDSEYEIVAEGVKLNINSYEFVGDMTDFHNQGGGNDEKLLFRTCDTIVRDVESGEYFYTRRKFFEDVQVCPHCGELNCARQTR